MNPFFFGASARQLYGAYDPPAPGSRRGVVLCPPLGREYLLSHPTCRYLARHLADAGWHALRFDYLGTGDSAGNEKDGGQEQWICDINLAVDELKDMEQLTDVALVGLRIGGALAAMAATRRSDLTRLVLWDPVFDGTAYLDELGVQQSRERGDVEASGAVFPAAVVSEIASLTPRTFGVCLPPTLIVNTTPFAAMYDPLETQIRETNVDCEQLHVPDTPVWRHEFGTHGAVLAVNAAKQVVTWLS